MNAQLSRDGAMTAMSVLRNIEALGGACREIEAQDDYYTRHEAAIAAGIAPLSGLSEFQLGYVKTLIECLVFYLVVGEPNLDDGGWMPEAAMRPEEVNAYRDALWH